MHADGIDLTALKADVIRWGTELGFQQIGVSDVDLSKAEERLAEYEKRVAQMYERGKAVNFATAFEIDEVIDPQATRQWILAGLKSAPPPAPRTGKKKPFVDTW